MSARDDDIEFDFFDDEPATSEAQSTQRVRLPRRGGSGGGPSRPSGPPKGVTPLVRLVLLVVGLIALVLILVLVVQSCASSSKRDAYDDYMADVRAIAAQSDANGRKLTAALTTQGVKVDDLEATLRGLADNERQLVTRSADLDPPGLLREENRHVVEALQLRVSGVDGLAATFRQTANSKSANDASLLTEQAQRLFASDVVWADLFKDPAVRQLQAEDLGGVRVPASVFVANRDLLNEQSMSNVLKRLRGAATGGTPTGLHGTNLVSTRALPANQTLQTGADNTVTASTDLAFAVTIEDSGDSQEVQIRVTLTIEKSDNPIVKTEQIDVINPGEQKTVTFSDLGQVPFATKTNLKVDVKAVPGETKTSNNSATYPVIFSLG
ncbi:MAG TPA: CARDB domain-containing protein [Gaiellaceae bacterium]|nr:CARDB domain-containing protein [Gaiellaceae bacterium]